MNSSTSRSKILAPLAVLCAAGALVVGSGATFTSTSENTISSVTSGTLTHSNSKADAAIFSLKNIKPGDVVNGSLTLTNTGSLPAAFSLTESSSSNGFAGKNLSLTIADTTNGTVVYDGTFGGLEDGVKQSIGEIEPGKARSFTFTVALDKAAGNEDQGKTASATYVWDAVQLQGQTTDQ